MLPEDERPQPEQQRQQLMLRNVEFGNRSIFPEDIIVEILLRLPVRHLLGLRCVCKSWCALIDDAYFIARHYHVQYSICKANGDIPIISYTSPLNSWKIALCMSVLSKQNGDIPVDLTADLVHDCAASFTDEPDRELFDKGHLVGVVYGIVCFIWGCKNLGLWNPATRDFMAVPPWQTPCIRFNFHDYNLGLIGFGYDYISNDFKILRELQGQCSVSLRHEVYSFTTKSWKTLNEVSPLVVSFKGSDFMKAYFNSVCYWSTYSSTPDILSFNLSTEVFEIFNPPKNAIGSKMGNKYTWEITLYKDYLAFVVICSDLEKVVSNFDVWVVTEFYGNSGVPKSWQHLHTFGPFPSTNELRLGAFRMDGDVLFVISPEEDSEGEYSSVYNPSSGKFKDLRILLPVSYYYVESLFPLSKRLVQS